jgi:hypothetical protein
VVGVLLWGSVMAQFVGESMLTYYQQWTLAATQEWALRITALEVL